MQRILHFLASNLLFLVKGFLQKPLIHLKKTLKSIIQLLYSILCASKYFNLIIYNLFLRY